MRYFGVILIAFCVYGQGGPTTGIAPSTGGTSSGAAGTQPGVFGLERPIIGEEYVLMPGDNIMVTITGPTSYSYSSTVLPEGKFVIYVPVSTKVSIQTGMVEPKYDYVDAVSIWGLTIKDAEEKFEKVFRRYFKGPKVNITLVTLRNFIVFVVGEVRRPGVAYASPVTRVSELLVGDKSITSLGSKAKIKVIRSDTTLIADLAHFETKGELKANPFVQDGDIIYIPPMAMKVTVRGAVFGRRGYELKTSQLTAEQQRISEGVYELLPDERVSDILYKAGGVTPWADLSSAYVERQISSHAERIKIDFEKVYRRDTLFDFILKDGDAIVIPSLKSNVYVEGEVVVPGPYEYEAGLTVRDYVGKAGGPTANAHLSSTSIKRGEDKFAYKPDLVIEPGDEIYVPRVVFKFWQDYLTIGQVITSIVLSWLTYTAVRGQ